MCLPHPTYPIAFAPGALDPCPCCACHYILPAWTITLLPTTYHPSFWDFYPLPMPAPNHNIYLLPQTCIVLICILCPPSGEHIDNIVDPLPRITQGPGGLAACWDRTLGWKHLTFFPNITLTWDVETLQTPSQLGWFSNPLHTQAFVPPMEAGTSPVTYHLPFPTLSAMCLTCTHPCLTAPFPLPACTPCPMPV